MLLKLENYLRDGLLILAVVFYYFMGKIIRDEIRLMVLSLLSIVFAVLLYRKIERDKKQGKVIDKWVCFQFWSFAIGAVLGVTMLVTNFFYPGLIYKQII